MWYQAKFNNFGNGETIGIYSGDPRDAAHSEFVCECQGPNMTADADLIVRTPQLLEACKSALTMLVSWPSVREQLPSDPIDLVAVLRAAIGDAA